jgi:hypothetical protein
LSTNTVTPLGKTNPRHNTIGEKNNQRQKFNKPTNPGQTNPRQDKHWKDKPKKGQTLDRNPRQDKHWTDKPKKGQTLDRNPRQDKHWTDKPKTGQTLVRQTQEGTNPGQTNPR